MATGRTRSEIVGFVAGGIFLAAFIAVAGWVIATQVTPGRSAAEVSTTIDAALMAGTKIEATRAMITPQLEQQLGTIEGLAFMVSLTRADGVTIVLKFKPDIGEEPTLAAVRIRLALMRASLPAARLPVSPSVDTNPQRIAYVALSSDRFTRAELARFAERFVKPRVQEIVGVGEVRILGAMREELRIRVDQARLAARGLSLQALEAALRQHRIETRAEPGEPGMTELWAPATQDPERIGGIVIGVQQDVPIYLRDVARISRDARHDGTLARFNGRDAVIVEVLKRPEADAGEVSRGLVQRLAVVLPMAPPGLRYETGYFCARCVEPRRR